MLTIVLCATGFNSSLSISAAGAIAGSDRRDFTRSARDSDLGIEAL